jgi:hypothetical protein
MNSIAFRRKSVIPDTKRIAEIRRCISLIILATTFWCSYTLEDVYGASVFERGELVSTRLAVPEQIDFASAVGLVDRGPSNYGNPADVFLEHRILNLSLGQSHWPLLPFLSWSYSAQVPLRVGIGTPIRKSCLAATLLVDYLFYNYAKIPGQQLHRGLLGGDFHASYNQRLGMSGHWLTTNQTLTKAVREPAEDESAFGLRVGGRLSDRYGCVARADMRSYEELESRRFEFSIIFLDHSFGYVHIDHQRRQQNVMWNRGIVFRVSGLRHSDVKPLWLWWQGKMSLTTGKAAGGGYLGWEIDCFPGEEYCEEWTRLTVFEYEARIGGEYRWNNRPWTLAVQAGMIGSNDHQSAFWNDGIFHPTDWGRIGLAASFIRQRRSSRQWVYTVGYEHVLPCLCDDRVDLDDIGGHFVKLGFHHRVEWRYTF